MFVSPLQLQKRRVSQSLECTKCVSSMTIIPHNFLVSVFFLFLLLFWQSPGFFFPLSLSRTPRGSCNIETVGMNMKRLPMNKQVRFKTRDKTLRECTLTFRCIRISLASLQKFIAYIHMDTLQMNFLTFLHFQNQQTSLFLGINLRRQVTAAMSSYSGFI